MADLEKIAEDLSSLTVLEAADLAKILDKKTPDVEHFRPYLEEARQSFLAKQA